ncbi:hypothetical protein C1T17_14540 [Sphingobium sp. SCG-1]|uniref:hypothetical protein n=1 Tax=Sphingobium sp. SCG-1 TaxID=2072936 RepID=UPI000CD6C419|nr:hypothetical protein [Sphingobium sp. SCG-1]AUW59127.1 hypothetical protein C1T17_14540 [Sphingobium sp. SCG-1]
MSARDEYLAAVETAEAKKQSFLANVQIARARVSPTRLKNDAKAKLVHTIDTTREKASDTVRNHPAATGLVGVGVIAYLFRRPLCRMTKRCWTRLRTPEEPAGLRTDVRDRLTSFRNALSRSITEFRHEK